ncbi:MAG: diguanylate cyclase, partial [Actinomycetota bacterium]
MKQRRAHATDGRVALWFSLRYATPFIVLLAVAVSPNNETFPHRALALLVCAQVGGAFITHVLALRGGRALSRAIAIGIVLDMSVVSAMISVSGGAVSPLVFLFPLHALSAGILLSSRAGWRGLAMSTVALILVDAVQPTGRHHPEQVLLAAFTTWLLGGSATVFSAYNERELLRRNAELGAIREVTLGIEHSLSLSEICATLCRGVADGFRFDSVAVLVQDGEHLRPTGAFGITGSHTTRVPVRGRVALAVSSSSPVVVPRDEATRDGALVDLIGARGYVAVPIDDILLVATRSPGRRRRARVHLHEVEALERLGHHARLAIANARLHERVSEAARTDRLTGLANRGELQRMLDAELGKLERYKAFRQVAGMAPSIVLFDVDHFKAVNDKHGHLVGDEVLKRIAETLRKNVRSFDLVGRWGGEEFAVVLPGTDEESARVMADRMRRAVHSEVVQTDRGKRVKLTVSAGIASSPVNGSAPDALWREADRALYRAKEEGRNRTCHASDTPVAGATILSMDASRRRQGRGASPARAASQRARGRSSLPT